MLSSCKNKSRLCLMMTINESDRAHPGLPRGTQRRNRSIPTSVASVNQSLTHYLIDFYHIFTSDKTGTERVHHRWGRQTNQQISPLSNDSVNVLFLCSCLIPVIIVTIRVLIVVVGRRTGAAKQVMPLHPWPSRSWHGVCVESRWKRARLSTTRATAWT